MRSPPKLNIFETPQFYALIIKKFTSYFTCHILNMNVIRDTILLFHFKFYNLFCHQVHLRGDGIFLEMVGGPIRGYPKHREKSRGVRTAGIHRRCMEHERRSSVQLHIYC